MKLRIIIIALLFPFSFSLVHAQLAMGKWRTHFAYNSVNQIAQSDRKIFGISEGALFSVDKEDLGIEFYNKQNGLSDNNIARIAYDNKSKQLLIVYKNGNIDLLSSGGIINIPDLYNKQLGSNKDVYNVLFNDNNAYLSCNFGILVINIPKAEIADTYYIGVNGAEVKVLNIDIHDSYIYALSTNTLYRGKLSEPNLVNFEFWTTITNLPGSGELKKIANFAGKLYLNRGGRMYVQGENNTWSEFKPELSIYDFLVSNNRFILFENGSKTYSLNQSLELSSIDNLGQLPDAAYDAVNESYWFAGNESGIVSYKQNGAAQPEIKNYKPLGPATNTPWNMTFSGSKLFVVQGGRWGSQYQRPGYVMMYENENWTNTDPQTVKSVTNQNVMDFMNVAVDPTDNSHFFVTSYGNGLFEFKNNIFSTWHNYTNSTIENIVPTVPYDYMRLDGAVYDKDGNLFMVNTGTESAIKILMKDGKWEQLTYPGARQTTMGRLTISNQNPNQKWVNSVRSSTGLLIFDDNATISDQSDDKSIYLASFVYPEIDNGQTKLMSISPSSIYTIVQDLNGVMWVGTDAGPFLFQNLSKVYDPEYTCSRVKIPRNDGTTLADYLLQNERIKSIAIDGANRKWLGTENSGVYLMSENGQQTIEHFTTENSPLLSNDLLSIAIHPSTGEVYFGTGNGIVSYQSNAVDGEQEYSNVHAYPNPVRESYKGIITITGLMKDSQVKITDLNGNLVCETVSNGGIATWDGKDLYGRKVSTGIYLAICVSSDGGKSTITKIMVIN